VASILVCNLWGQYFGYFLCGQFFGYIIIFGATVFRYVILRANVLVILSSGPMFWFVIFGAKVLCCNLWFVIVIFEVNVFVCI